MLVCRLCNINLKLPHRGLNTRHTGARIQHISGTRAYLGRYWSPASKSACIFICFILTINRRCRIRFMPLAGLCSCWDDLTLADCGLPRLKVDIPGKNADVVLTSQFARSFSLETLSLMLKTQKYSPLATQTVQELDEAGGLTYIWPWVNTLCMYTVTEPCLGATCCVKQGMETRSDYLHRPYNERSKNLCNPNDR